MRNSLYFVLLAVCFTFFGSAEAKNCQEVRMGLDIGSGSTKMMVAKVDFCQKKILEVLAQDSRQVSYNEDLEKSADGNLSPAIVEKGLGAIKELTDKAKTFKPKRNYGVATSVFRKSKNGKDVIQGFAKKLKLRLEVINQEEEARLGYLSAQSFVDEKMLGGRELMVWDIGGGSMQMYTEEAKGGSQKYLGDLASVTFKNMVIEVLEGKTIETTSSPNPIADKREAAIALARSYARIHVPATMRAGAAQMLVVGVGGVHGYSIKNQITGQLKDKPKDEAKYTLIELDEVGKIQAKKSDSELSGDYRATDVSNLFLVQGFMEALGIKEVMVFNTTLLQGVVLKN